jgi:hypothetical protein
VRTPDLQSGGVNRVGRARVGLPSGDVRVAASTWLEIKCPPPLFHLAGGVLVDGGERLEVVCACGSRGSTGLGFLRGWRDGGADALVDFVLRLRRRGRVRSDVATELRGLCTGVGLASVVSSLQEAGFAGAGFVGAGGRRSCSPSTLSTGFGGVVTWTSSGFFPADVPQRKQPRRARRVRLEVHKAAMTARVLLRVLVCWFHLLLHRRLRRRRLQEMVDGVLHKDLQGLFVIFCLVRSFVQKCRNNWRSGVFVLFPRCNQLLL